MKLKQKLAAATLAAGIGVGGGAVAASGPASAAVEATPAVAPVPRHGDACTASPDSGPTFNFHNACHWHDWCYGAKPYGRGYSGRLACDTGFLSRMNSSCNNRYGSWDPRRYTCRAIAYQYYDKVRDFGWIFW